VSEVDELLAKLGMDQNLPGSTNVLSHPGGNGVMRIGKDYPEPRPSVHPKPDIDLRESQPVEQEDPELTDEQLKALHDAELERYRFKDRRFPTAMGEEAFYGVAGDIVRIISPVSEASREATISQFLVAIANLLGRSAHRKQAGIHHLNEDTVIVGETAIARKGSSWVPIYSLLNLIAQDWAATRIKDGFQSGEAIIHAVRDEMSGTIPVNKRKAGHADVAEEAVLDHGVDDKRLLMHEEEFGRLLTVASRSGNTLSPTLRKAWDGKPKLYTEGKISPEKATNAHVSMIGHITVNELLDCLKEVENKNGFTNRVLWIAARRTQKISVPEWIDWSKKPDITLRLKKVIDTFGMDSIEREIIWRDDTKALWDVFYKSINATNKGIIGSIIARSDAHVLRLAMIYAVLDASSIILPEHLQAAIAFWRYCERSAMWIFGEKTGNKDADQIFWALQRESKGNMTRSEISLNVFNNHVSKQKLDQAFSILVDSELATMKLERCKGKRPTEIWFPRRDPI
jgi:Protein of unknown function (DUF3987)